MKLNISNQRFNEIIKEEVEKFRKIQQLESKKKALEEGLKKIQEAQSQEEIDELWGGLKKLFQTGGQNVANAAQSTYQNVKNDINATKQAIQQKGQQIVQAAKQKANAVKQVYQQGEKDQDIKTTKSQIEKLWKQRQIIQNQLNIMQSKYSALTGQKHNNKFQPKPKQPVQSQSVQTPNTPPQQNAA